MSEIWKDIEGFEGRYQVSNFGNVRSIDRTTLTTTGYRTYKGRNIKFTTSNGQYYIAGLSNGTFRRHCTVHRLVMEAFVGKSKLVINHIDGNSFNNKLENLEYVSLRENQNHRRMMAGEKVRGYRIIRGLYQAVVKINKKTIYLGLHKTPEEAKKAYADYIINLNEGKYL